MKGPVSEVVGGKNPDHAIVGCIHGDERCGYEAIERLKSSGIEFKKPVKFLIANEEARRKELRYIDKDLNRCFPGDEESDIHEERIAPKILEEIEGMKVLDLHSTFSDPTPVVFFTGRDSMDIIEATGVEKAVENSFMEETMMNYTRAVVVECGKTGSDEASETAFKIAKNFLAAEGIIEADYEISEPQLYTIIGEELGEDYVFTRENFEVIEKGETYARRERDGRKKVAEKEFIPILMSDNGYPHKIGYKGRKMN